MNTSLGKSDPSPRFVDTATNEDLVHVYEKHVRFNFALKSGERQIYLDAMKARGMDIEKYIGDEKLPSEYQEKFPPVAKSRVPRIRDRVASLMRLR